MTAAWSQMMIGYMPDQLICHRKADLYLMLAPDAPFVDDGTRVYKTPEQRERFNRIARDTLTLSRTSFVEISGGWDERFDAAVRAIDAMIASKGLGVAEPDERERILSNR
jgi:nicotinamide riboside kinase